MNKRIFAVCALLVLVGCAPSRQVAYRPATAAEMLTADPTKSCMARLHEDPFIAENLDGKIGSGGGAAPSIQMLSDTAKPTGQEKDALSAFFATRQRCIALGTEYRETHLSRKVVEETDEAVQNLTRLLAGLYAGDMTYGDYNTARMSNDQTMLERMRASARADQETAMQKQVLEDQQRRANAALMLQYMQQQQLSQQLLNQQQQQQQQQQLFRQNQPIRTNCTRLGDQVSCTSY